MPPSAPYHHPACQHRLVAKARLPEFLESAAPLPLLPEDRTVAAGEVSRNQLLNGE